jgi:hypothetical protein
LFSLFLTHTSTDKHVDIAIPKDIYVLKGKKEEESRNMYERRKMI